jgi:hypothetical protein
MISITNLPQEKAIRCPELKGGKGFQEILAHYSWQKEQNFPVAR